MKYELSLTEIILAYVVMCYSAIITILLLRITRKYLMLDKEFRKQHKKYAYLNDLDNFIKNSKVTGNDYILEEEFKLIKNFRSLPQKKKDKILAQIPNAGRDFP